MIEPVMALRDGRSPSHQLKLVARPASAVEIDEAPKANPAPRTPEGEEFIWNDDAIAADNYAAMGERLSAGGDLLRAPHGGLLLALSDGRHGAITKGADLAPVIVDRVPVRVMRGGKTKGSMIAAAHLNAMPKARCFLDHFRPVDTITDVPLYLPDFGLTKPGYNDGGPGFRILYTGGNAEVSNSLGTIRSFLEVMGFDTEADRTNAVAAALTVILRNFWPGGKPVIVVTATKSHAGKDTVIAFATGVAKSISISYQATNWAIERSFVGAVRTTPDAAVITVENARLDGRDQFIASAFLERLATDPEPMLFSTGTGAPMRIRNDFVLAISTNFGKVSEDILNRSLPIHLSPVGDVTRRKSPIGNPKLEFLPAYRGQIAAELRGMVERWKEAGKPLDEEVQHPFSVWAKIVGGILKVNGFADFLQNYGTRRVHDDPLRKGLGLLGVERPDTWLRPKQWAQQVVDAGLVKTLIPESDRENEISRARGIGLVLSVHEGESLDVETDTDRLVLRLEKKRGRWNGSEPHVRYRFTVLHAERLPDRTAGRAGSAVLPSRVARKSGEELK